MYKRGFVSGIAFGLVFGANVAAAEDETPDPLQGFNRGVQAFNDTADRFVLKPVAKGYTKVVPEGVRHGIGNFFQNLTYPLVVVNQFLQGKVKLGVSDTGRFVMNSTLGILGFWDPASSAGMPAHEEDFGQTFAKWGIGSGPFIVLPFLGPSNARDGTGSVISYFLNPVQLVTDDTTTRISLTAVNLIQTRAGLLEAEKLISGDRYIFMRDAYLQHRDYLNKDGQVDDEFLDEDWEE